MTGYQTYQGNQVEGAGPLGLVLLTYEALYKSLGKARLAVHAGDMEAEADHTSRAIEAVLELTTSLNMEEGGEVAESLSKLYYYMMDRLMNGMCTKSCDHLDELIQLVLTLREGWEQLQQQNNHASRPAVQPPAAMADSRMMAYAG